MVSILDTLQSAVLNHDSLDILTRFINLEIFQLSLSSISSTKIKNLPYFLFLICVNHFPPSKRPSFFCEPVWCSIINTADRIRKANPHLFRPPILCYVLVRCRYNYSITSLLPQHLGVGLRLCRLSILGGSFPNTLMD